MKIDHILQQYIALLCELCEQFAKQHYVLLMLFSCVLYLQSRGCQMYLECILENLLVLYLKTSTLGLSSHNNSVNSIYIFIYFYGYNN